MCLTKGQKKARDQVTNCAYCHRKLYDSAKSGDRPTVDHFYPLSSGDNLNRYWNRLTVCFRCNQLKGNKLPKEFIAHLQRQLKKQQPGNFARDLQDIIKNITATEKKLSAYYLMRDIL